MYSLRIYFSIEDGKKKLACIGLHIDGEEHCSADVRPERGNNNIVTVAYSGTTLKSNGDLEEDAEHLIEVGYWERRVITLEPILTDVKRFGISYLTFDNPIFNP